MNEENQIDPVAERARALAAKNAKKLREALAENAKLKAQIEELEEQLAHDDGLMGDT